MIRSSAIASILMVHASLAAADPESTEHVLLPIPPRQQWNENNGYCGECSVQQAAMYFGTYASQYVCRAIINPDQRRQLLVGVNDQKVLKALRLTSDEYNNSIAPTPQYEDHFCWLKEHLQVGNPVIIVAYAQWGTDPDYDHIMLAIGYKSRDATTYHSHDHLYFNTNFSKVTNDRQASALFDTRSMEKNGAVYEYCIPKIVDYGCAVTGIEDDSHAALPVQIHLHSWDEPDIIAGDSPVLFNAKVTVGGLLAGGAYTLYRYDDYEDVPAIDYSQSNYTSAVPFVATSTTATFSEQIISDGVAVFRCLPKGF